VSDLTPIAAPDLPVGPALPTLPSREIKRHLLAALFSAIVPGTGQLFLGRRRKGSVLFLIFVALLIGFWPLRLLRFYAGFVLLYCTWIALYIYAACSAQLARGLPASARPSKWWLGAIVPLALLTLSLLGQVVTRVSGFKSFTVPSTSMERTITQGDHIVADMRYYHSRRPEHREIIIFLIDSTFRVKRVIATSGDTVEGRHNAIFINGKEQDEAYVEHRSRAAEQAWMSNFGPILIPNGKYFVMGDNRDVSFDSRAPEFGLVNDNAIVGKALYIFGSDRQGRTVR